MCVCGRKWGGGFICRGIAILVLSLPSQRWINRGGVAGLVGCEGLEYYMMGSRMWGLEW